MLACLIQPCGSFRLNYEAAHRYIIRKDGVIRMEDSDDDGDGLEGAAVGENVTAIVAHAFTVKGAEGVAGEKGHMTIVNESGRGMLLHCWADGQSCAQGLPKSERVGMAGLWGGAAAPALGQDSRELSRATDTWSWGVLVLECLGWREHVRSVGWASFLGTLREGGQMGSAGVKGLQMGMGGGGQDERCDIHPQVCRLLSSAFEVRAARRSRPGVMLQQTLRVLTGQAQLMGSTQEVAALTIAQLHTKASGSSAIPYTSAVSSLEERDVPNQAKSAVGRGAGPYGIASNMVTLLLAGRVLAGVLESISLVVSATLAASAHATELPISSAPRSCALPGSADSKAARMVHEHPVFAENSLRLSCASLYALAHVPQTSGLAGGVESGTQGLLQVYSDMQSKLPSSTSWSIDYLPLLYSDMFTLSLPTSTDSCDVPPGVVEDAQKLYSALVLDTLASVYLLQGQVSVPPPLSPPPALFWRQR